MTDADYLKLGNDLYSKVDELALIANKAIGCTGNFEHGKVIGTGYYGKLDYDNLVNGYVSPNLDLKIKEFFEIVQEEDGYYIPCQDTIVKNENFKKTTLSIKDKKEDIIIFDARSTFCGCDENKNYSCEIEKESTTDFIIKKINGNWVVDQIIFTQYNDCNGIIDKLSNTSIGEEITTIN